jgi:hypothetical protein
MRYILVVNGTSLTPDELRAAAETHGELGPEYQSAVIESFIDKVGKEIDARVDARLRQAQAPAPYPGPYQGQMPMPRQHGQARGSQLALAIVSMALGIPLTGIALVGSHSGTLALFIIWMGIVAVNAAFALVNRPPSR